MASAIASKLQSLPPNLRALVVGGTSGIGQAIAIQLANSLPAAKITIAGRNATVGQELSAAHPNIDFRSVDASLMKDVKRFCNEYTAEASFGKDKGYLDVLVLTQGILTMQGRTPTTEGLDVKMALHYYSRMLFVRELLAHGALSPSALIMTVLDGKGGNFNSKGIKWEDMDLRAPSNYGISKCAEHCVAFTDVMIQHFAAAPDVHDRVYIHAYPGFVNTNLMSVGNVPTIAKWGLKAIGLLLAVSPETCGERLLSGAIDCKAKAAETNQRWFNIDEKGKEVPGKAVADKGMQERVASATWDLVDGLSTTT